MVWHSLKIMALSLASYVAGSVAVKAAVPIVFEFQDAPGEGFFDDALLSDPDVPNASTLGEARRTVVEAAATYLGSFFEPQYQAETWRVSASFDPFDDSIASAAPTEWRAGDSFAGGIAGVNFPAVLANHRFGAELVAGNGINARFSSSVDFDLSTTDPPADFEESLFSTAVHEMMHGLGFYSDVSDFGFYYDTIPTIFDTFLVEGDTPLTTMGNIGRRNAMKSDNLFFVGERAQAANPLGVGPVPIHAPATFEEGSTGSHLDRVAFASTGDLMLPEAPAGVAERLTLSRLDLAILADLGYVLASPSVDADLDGRIDGYDFLVIQRTDPAFLPAWEVEFGSAAATARTSSVPEPSALALIPIVLLGARASSPGRTARRLVSAMQR